MARRAGGRRFGGFFQVAADIETERDHQDETSRLGIITRHNAVRSPAAQCFTDCLLQEIRRRARSAAQKDSELFDELEVLY
ncbi:hypothetical protein C265_10741 [Cupriavidus sp. GA3-3]|uniref:Uncharacterized protein n=1 Tax=Cupriavidus necator (strain ATCC 17699 / DSM 428 / KCTC 22496 / NCIMB 10442 / H16 / Stanier 337) TaxID=381666 RepID=Q0JZD1_CUPNH|nr:hypothetical protein C265_10741 [Cupriavidus sp. GA3-3]CAJ96893.1 Hypothetical protein H16_B2111 [Cupriavidus necator H16]